jgi:hypothetical protein
MKRTVTALVSLGLLLASAPGWAVVHYERGRRFIKGVQLLQDVGDSTAYFYVPQFPRLATRPDGSFEILCLKYVDADPSGKASGGLFHALIEFTLPEDLQAELEKELKKQVPGARLVGPVPLLQAAKDGGEGTGSFRIVSGILTDKEKGGFAQSVVTSDEAPLVPGSKAVVAAILNQQGATLLWSSLTSPTSDVSVSIHASYEAAVEAYNAKVTADVSTVYKHLSEITNRQENYTKRQVRKVIDDLQRTGALKVETLDRTAGLGIKATEMEGILQIVTSKLTELMFDHTGGWAADPPRETAVENNQIQGRQSRGFFSRLFRGTGNQKYYTDDQYVLKDRTDIRHNTFSLVLTKNSTIRVPVDTAGNLGGLYTALGADPRYFRVVSLADPAFESRSIHFQVDGGYVDSFQDTVNFVAVNLRKVYSGQPAFTRSLRFSDADIKAGKTVQDVAIPRLGVSEADWLEYEYQVRWSLRDGPTVSLPAQEERWLRATDPAISLLPPFAKRVIEIDADRQLFTANGIATAVVEFATVLAGKPKLSQKATLRATDAAPTTRLAVYHDRGTPVAVRVKWYSPAGKSEGKLQLLDSDSLFLTPPTIAVDPAGGGR